MMTVANMTSRLDDVLPTYDRDEKHVTTINASPHRVYAAIWQMTPNELPSFVCSWAFAPCLRS